MHSSEVTLFYGTTSDLHYQAQKPQRTYPLMSFYLQTSLPELQSPTSAKMQSRKSTDLDCASRLVMHHHEIAVAMKVVDVEVKLLYPDAGLKL